MSLTEVYDIKSNVLHQNQILHAYFYNKQLENNLQMQYETSNFGGGIKDYPFVGIYAGGNTNSGSRLLVY